MSTVAQMGEFVGGALGPEGREVLLEGVEEAVASMGEGLREGVVFAAFVVGELCQGEGVVPLAAGLLEGVEAGGELVQGWWEIGVRCRGGGLLCTFGEVAGELGDLADGVELIGCEVAKVGCGRSWLGQVDAAVGGGLP